jgi:hypothetical protein
MKLDHKYSRRSLERRLILDDLEIVDVIERIEQIIEHYIPAGVVRIFILCRSAAVC